MAPWFEEMMIARCNFDSTRTREAIRYAMKRMEERRADSGSVDMTNQTDKDLRELQDEERSRQEVACQQAVRVSAQRALSR